MHIRRAQTFLPLEVAGQQLAAEQHAVYMPLPGRLLPATDYRIGYKKSMG